MSAIVDQFGRPATSNAGLYRTPSSNPNAYRAKPQLRQRTFENVTPAQRRDLINWCWGIYTRIPNVGAAIEFKSDFACSDGCYLQYHGTDRDWGRRLETFINETYYANCNLAGPNHDFHNTLWELSIALETHGQAGWVFDSGSGKVKIISATSIGNGMSPDSTSGKVYDLGNANDSLALWGLSVYGGSCGGTYLIERGSFAGKLLIDGIIVDRNMVTQGYRVVGFDANGKPAAADLSTAQMGLIYEPKFPDQIMGYPGLSDLVEAVGTVDDWNFYIGQAMKLSAAWAVTRKSKDGQPKTSGLSYSTVEQTNPAGETVNRVVAHQIVQAGVYELATDNNEEIATVNFERPSMNEEAFIERIETGFFAKHWPREFIYTKGFGRASARIGVVQARQKVWRRQRTLQRFALDWLRRKTAHAMEHKEIPRNDNLFDPYNISLSSPAQITVDEGNDAKIDLAKLGRGVTSHRVICAKDGYDDERIEDENFTKRTRLMEKAAKTAQEHLGPDGKPIWTAKEVLQMIDNLGNPNQAIDLSAPEDPEDASNENTPPKDANPPPPNRNGAGDDDELAVAVARNGYARNRH